MIDLFRKLKANSILYSLTIIICGLLLLFAPAGSSILIVQAVGCFILVLGVIRLVGFFATQNAFIWYHPDFIIGILVILAGFFILKCPHLIISFIPLVIGIILVLHGLHDIQQSLYMKKMGYSRWGLTITFAGILLLIGIIVLFNSFTTATIILRLIGIALIYDSISDFWISRCRSNVDITFQSPDISNGPEQTIANSTTDAVDVDFKDLK